MKRIVSLALVILMIACTLVGCKKVCESCEQSYSGRGNKIEFDGEKMVVCDECYEEIKPWLDLATGLGDLFS